MRKVETGTSKGIVMSLLLALMALLCFSPGPATAAAIAVSPSSLQVDDALRGGQFESTITVFNPDSEASGYAFSTTGDAAEWVSFYAESGPTSRIEEVTIPGNGKVRVLVRFNIPQDAANGQHGATIVVTNVPLEAGSGSGQMVSLSAQVAVTIVVTGVQRVSATVDRISIADVEVKYPLRLAVQLSNSGNVTVVPQISLKVTAQDGSVLDTRTYSGLKVKPGSREAIPIEWDTAGKQAGNYGAEVAVALDSGIIHSEALRFAILPAGTFTRAGALSELVLRGEARAGSLVVAGASFVNTGQIDTKAKFTGEVYCDGDLIGVVESAELLVPVGARDTLEAYLRLDRAGKYSIRGYVNYEGKKTELKELSFAVAGSGGAEGAAAVAALPEAAVAGEAVAEEPDRRPFGPWSPSTVAAIAVAGIVIILLSLRRARRSSW